ncbi:MAG: hypothetical protein U0411_11925 [Thermodesulfovibrionales bacterium]
MVRFLIGLYVAAFVSTLAGCGGGGGEGSGSGSTGASSTISGQVQASWINGVKVCVKETLGTQEENCAVSSGQGTFTLGSAEGKELSLLIGGVEVGTVPGNQVAEGMTITPAVLSGGDTLKEVKIKAVFHQSVTPVSGSGDSAVYDLSSLSEADINALDLANYLNGSTSGLLVAGKEIDYMKELRLVVNTPAASDFTCTAAAATGNGASCTLPTLAFSCTATVETSTDEDSGLVVVTGRYAACTTNWSRSSEASPYNLLTTPVSLSYSVLGITPSSASSTLNTEADFWDSATASWGVIYRSDTLSPDQDRSDRIYFGEAGSVEIKAQVPEMVGGDCTTPAAVVCSGTFSQ